MGGSAGKCDDAGHRRVGDAGSPLSLPCVWNSRGGEEVSSRSDETDGAKADYVSGTWTHRHVAFFVHGVEGTRGLRDR